jgi:hypothetical protein
MSGAIRKVLVGSIVVDRKTAHLFNVTAIGSEYPPQQAKKEQEEDDKRDHRPDLYVLDAL